jgi:hypothetical protein
MIGIILHQIHSQFIVADQAVHDLYPLNEGDQADLVGIFRKIFG